MSRTYAELEPPPALAAVVDRYWCAEGDASDSTRILPDGCADIIFDVDRTAFIGAMTSAVVVSPSSATSFGVRFLPGGAAHLLGLPLSEITNQSVTPSDAFGEGSAAAVAFNALAGEVRRASDTAARVRILDSFIAARCALNDSRARMVAHAWQMMAGPRMPRTVSALAADLGVGERTLERIFLQHAGMTPKQAMRVARMKTAVRRMRARPAHDLGRIGLECGYYDQPHFCNEFVRLTGVSPEQWRNSGR